MAELVYAHALGACTERCTGSSPAPGTKLRFKTPRLNSEFFNALCSLISRRERDLVSRSDDGGVVSRLGVAPKIRQTVVIDSFGGNGSVVRIGIHRSAGAVGTVWQDGLSEDGAGNLETGSFTVIKSGDEADAVCSKITINASIDMAIRSDEPGVDVSDIVLNVNVAVFRDDQVLRNAVDGTVAEGFVA